MPKCYSNKVAKHTHRDGCSPVNVLHFFKTSFLKNSSRWLLLGWPSTALSESSLLYAFTLK